MTADGHLVLTGLVKRFKEEVAVDGLDLDIRPGEFFSLLGASGCGKTTTLRMVAGFERPDEGSIILDGLDLLTVPPHRRPVNTVFQSYALFPFMTVRDNVAFGLKYQSVSRRDTRSKVGSALELVEMADFAKRKPHQLSGGQQQRVALARALVLEPTVLLLDEPLGALDAKLRKQLQVELRQVQKRVHTTFVYVTHDQEEALTMSDRLAVLVDGRVEQLGTPSQIYSQPATAYVAGFMGTANLFDATVHRVDDGVASCLVGGLTLRAPASPLTTPHAEVSLVVRPERIEISPAADLGDGSDANVHTGQVEQIVFLGAHTHLRVRVGECLFIAEVSNVHGALPEWVREGEKVCMRISTNAIQVLERGRKAPRSAVE
jgi:spermidine/putrescine transport system ATP-binding protein